MRRLVIIVGAVIFAAGFANSGWAQSVDVPNGGGRVIPMDTGSGIFRAPVFTSGNVDTTLRVIVDGVLKYTACSRIVTCGPTVLVSSTVPLGKFGLKSGGWVTFEFIIDHVQTSSLGKRSILTAKIPVIGAAGSTGSTGDSGRVEGDGGGETGRLVRGAEFRHYRRENAFSARA